MLINRYSALVVIGSLATFYVQANTCRAAFTFLGPTPYFSAADSPFPVDGSNPNFYLEDFEDGELNTPGIFQPLHPLFGTAFHGTVRGPSENTSSVDADDGVVDGSGTAGHSFQQQTFFVSPDIPQLNQILVEFEFNTTELGYAPNAFGFVWTDGPAGLEIGNHLALHFQIMELNGVKSDYLIRPDVSAERNGQSTNDIFLGAVATQEITHVSVFANYRGESELMSYMQIDHVQYGLITIPEPNTLAIILELLVVRVIGAPVGE